MDAVAAGKPGFLFRTFRRNLSAKIAAIPMVLTVLVVFVGCSIWTVVYSFTNSKSLPSTVFVGLAQYNRLFKDLRWQTSVYNIFLYGLLALAVMLVIGFVLAVLMDQKIRFENTFRTIYLYPYALSLIVTGVVWQWILQPDLGLQAAIRHLGWASFTFEWLTDRHLVLYALVIAGVWQGSGFVMVLMLAGLRGIDDEIWKAALVDGIPKWRTYVSIVLPMMRGTLVTTLVIVGAGLVRTYDLVVAMTAGGPGVSSEVPTKYIYNYMFGGQNLGQAMSASTSMLAAVLVVLVPWAYFQFGRRRPNS